MPKTHQNTFDLEKACELASLKIVNGEELLINSRFNLFDKSNLGVLLFLAVGLFAIAITTIHATDLAQVFIGLFFGIGIAGFSVLTLFKQITDYIKLTNNEFEFRNSLRKRTIKMSPELKIKIRTKMEHVKLKSLSGSGSDFRVVELFLVSNSKELRVLDFQMAEKFSSEANSLGSEISHQIKERIKACTSAKSP